MARLLILSSWVAAGHVGLCAAQPVLHALGHEVTALPTVMLSNHRAWPHSAGRTVPVAEIDAMIDAIDGNGWLRGHDALLTGYLPSAAHVDLAARLTNRLRRLDPAIPVIVDPVLGDEPKGLYLGEDAAWAIRDTLVPCANILTPNLFELEWLTDMPARTLHQAQDAAEDLLGQPRMQQVLITSPPVSATETGVLDVNPRGATLYRTSRRDGVPNGVGDVFAAMIAAGVATDHALGHLDTLVAENLGAPHLAIVPSAPRWTAAKPVPGAPLAPNTKG